MAKARPAKARQCGRPLAETSCTRASRAILARRGLLPNGGTRSYGGGMGTGKGIDIIIPIYLVHGLLYVISLANLAAVSADKFIQGLSIFVISCFPPLHIKRPIVARFFITLAVSRRSPLDRPNGPGSATTQGAETTKITDVIITSVLICIGGLIIHINSMAMTMAVNPN